MVDEPVLEMFSKYDSLIVGTPTWNTGVDVERSGIGGMKFIMVEFPN